MSVLLLAFFENELFFYLPLKPLLGIHDYYPATATLRLHWHPNRFVLLCFSNKFLFDITVNRAGIMKIECNPDVNGLLAVSVVSSIYQCH